MLGHPGGEKHSRYLIELAFLEPKAKWLDMGAGDGRRRKEKAEYMEGVTWKLTSPGGK